MRMEPVFSSIVTPVKTGVTVLPTKQRSLLRNVLVGIPVSVPDEHPTCSSGLFFDIFSTVLDSAPRSTVLSSIRCLPLRMAHAITVVTRGNVSVGLVGWRGHTGLLGRQMGQRTTTKCPLLRGDPRKATVRRLLTETPKPPGTAKVKRGAQVTARTCTQQRRPGSGDVIQRGSPLAVLRSLGPPPAMLSIPRQRKVQSLNL